VVLRHESNQKNKGKDLISYCYNLVVENAGIRVDSGEWGNRGTGSYTDSSLI
jgi:hypothetical protein